MATQRVLQLLRSSQTYASFTAAKNAIVALTGRKDGEIVLARYISGTSGEPAVNTYESAIGVYFQEQNKWTVFQSSTEIEAAIKALQDELDATQAGAGLGSDGSYVAPESSSDAGYEILGGQGAPDNIKDAVMTLADAIAAMDYSNNYTAGSGNTPASATDASKVISGINQENGKLDAVTTDAVDLLLTGYQKTAATGSIAGTDTLENALSKLENATAAGTHISEAEDNQLHYITDDQRTSDVDESGLYTKLSIAALDSTELAALNDANVREAYKLYDTQDGNETAIGDVIKIYKDSSLQSVYLGHVDDTLTNADSTTHESADTAVTNGTGSEALCFIYHLENGNYKLVAVDLESFLQESEFGDGLIADNSTHVVSVNKGDGLDFDSSNPKKLIVKKDSTSEQVYTAASTPADVLTVSSGGVKVANVQNAINYATDQVLSTTVTASNERGVNGAQNTTPHISITETTDSTTGLHSYAITETDIASEDELDAEITRAESAETAIDAAVGLTKAANAETRSYTPQVTVRTGETAPTTVAGDIDLLDSHVEALNNAAVKSVTGSDAININTTSPNDAQNPKVELKLSAQAASIAADASYAGGNNTSNILQVKSDGLYLDNVWDCGTFGAQS